MSDQWVAKNSERDPNAWDVFTDEGVLIFRGMWETQGTRAKLAAAAPDLLEAAEVALPVVEALLPAVEALEGLANDFDMSGTSPGLPTIKAKLREAIDKARGR